MIKKFFFIGSLFFMPIIGLAQDNVNVDNKKPKEKEGPLNNAAIKKSKKKMNKQGAQFDKSKYNAPARSGGHKGDKKGGGQQPATPKGGGSKG